MPSKLLSTAEVAAIMGVRLNNISRLCRADRVPGAVNIGGRWLIPEISIPLIVKDDSHTPKKYRQKMGA